MAAAASAFRRSLLTRETVGSRDAMPAAAGAAPVLGPLASSAALLAGDPAGLALLDGGALPNRLRAWSAAFSLANSCLRSKVWWDAGKAPGEAKGGGQGGARGAGRR